MVDYLSSQADWAGYQVSTKKGSGPVTVRQPQPHNQKAASKITDHKNKGLADSQYNAAGTHPSLDPFPERSDIGVYSVSIGFDDFPKFRGLFKLV